LLKYRASLNRPGLVANLSATSHEDTRGKLKLGDPIPAVTSTDQNGRLIGLAQAAKTGYALVYFYPKAMTAGSTAQACSLRDAYAQLQEKGVKVFGVSLDPVETQKEFEQKEHLPFELLSDADRQVTSAFTWPRVPCGGDSLLTALGGLLPALNCQFCPEKTPIAPNPRHHNATPGAHRAIERR
jgi:peroxiredoxin